MGLTAVAAGNWQVNTAMTVVKIVIFVYNLAKNKGKTDLKTVENMALESMKSDITEILDLLHMEDWEDVKNAIEVEQNALGMPSKQ